MEVQPLSNPALPRTRLTRGRPPWGRWILLRLLAIIAPGLISHAAAQATNEVELIRREMEVMRSEYERRLRALEDRLREVEARSLTNQPPAMPGSGLAAAETNAPPVIPGLSTTVSPTRGGGTNVFYPFRTDFRAATESRQRSIAARQETAFRERMEELLESFVDISGYFRAGYGINNEGGPQSGFQAPGAFSKYRLGNEAEVYGELGFHKKFYVPQLFSVQAHERPSTSITGPVASVKILVSAYNPYESLLNASDTDFGLPEAWASLGKIFPAQPNLQFWAGTRFYRRHDIHISDFYFYNMSGAGGGIEDFQLPFGKAALAWIGAGATSGFSDLPQPDAQNRAGFSKENIDLRLYDVAVPLGKGEFGLAFARSTAGRDALGNSAADAVGFSATALHIRESFLSWDGFNKLSLQFGTGPAKTFTSGYETVQLPGGLFIRPDAENSWRFRFTEHFIANIGKHFSLSPALVYQITDYGSGHELHHWASAGVRPIVHFNRFFSLAFEGGFDWVQDPQADSSGYLTKFTLAPQVSLGNRFLSRPVIRAYLTHAFWSDAFVGQVGGIDYLTSDTGWTYGLQMEAWW